MDSFNDSFSHPSSFIPIRALPSSTDGASTPVSPPLMPILRLAKMDRDAVLNWECGQNPDFVTDAR
jgi:hypothetical protein